MQESRWLLPFTSTINLRAIDLVLGMAEQCGATLIAASLIVVPNMQREQQHQGPRLEYVQQSKDFLEAVRWKATQYHVTIEPHELWTGDVHERIKKLVFDLHCDSIVLVTNKQESVLLDGCEMGRLLMDSVPASFMLVRMPGPARNPRVPVGKRFCSLVRGLVSCWKEEITCLGQGSY